MPATGCERSATRSPDGGTGRARGHPEVRTALRVVLAVGAAVGGIDSIGAAGVAFAFGFTLPALAYAVYRVARFAGGIAGAAVRQLLTRLR